MSTYKVEFSRRANAQIDKIFHDIAQDNPTAAFKMVDTIEEKITNLAHNPYMGMELLQEDYPFLEPGYRRLIVSPFLIYYRVAEPLIFITHIVHGRRDQKNALQNL
ncbi:MAG: type II toxin-antitoxin system RelE/ParE family toxin [Peptococcaceae bacterium]|nr:type II toxin-antitoxin system RelE/ParE family toxin [Peptococcaceae bacterium]